MNRCIVIDDFIPLSLQEEIKNTMLGRYFPWSFLEDITSGSQEVTRLKSPAAVHYFRDRGQTQSEFFSLVAPLAHLGAGAVGFKFTDVAKCRSFLQYPLNPKSIEKEIDYLHIDLDKEHLVVLYYVIDADGDTLIVDKEREPGVATLDARVEDYNVIQRVTPKQGRVVLFDGKYYHTAEQPSMGMRCIVNFDIV
jgi:hypothetical protein